MADPAASQQAREGTSTTTTVTVDTTDSPHHQDVPTLHLTLRKPKSDRKVQWTTETVDNEEMDKKKSKSCCIYKKPRAFGESSSDESSDDEDDCDHCKDHSKKKKVNRNVPNPPEDIPQALSSDRSEEQPTVHFENTL